MALIAVVLSATLVACGDDDDECSDSTKIETSNSVKVGIAGSLSTLLEDKVQTITSLKVTGNLNGDDIICLRQMLCCSDEKSDTWGVLTTLDLSEATIVEGGSAYYKDYYTSNNIIGQYMFHNCENLEEIALPNGLTSIGENAFEYCKTLSSVIIGSNVTSIGNYAFRSCSALTSINIPSGVMEISDYTFYDCTALIDIILPENATSIGNYAFASSGLTEVSIGNDVTSIGSHAFASCSALQNITLHNPTPPTAYTSSFTDVDKGTCILYVPSGAKNTYSTTSVWKDFKNIVEIE